MVSTDLFCCMKKPKFIIKIKNVILIIYKRKQHKNITINKIMAQVRQAKLVNYH
jgi:hypothetical protein